MNKNYDQMIKLEEASFYRELGKRVDEDDFDVLLFVAEAINTGKTSCLDPSLEGATIRRLIAVNESSAERSFLRYIVFEELSKSTADSFSCFMFHTLAFFSICPFDRHYAAASLPLIKLLDISEDKFPYRNVFVNEISFAVCGDSVYLKYHYPDMLFFPSEVAALEHEMDKKTRYYLNLIRRLSTWNRHRILHGTDSFQISRLSHDEYYPKYKYKYIYIPEQEFLTSYAKFSELYLYDYQFGYETTRTNGGLTVIHEPQGMEFRVRMMPKKEDYDLIASIFHLVDAVFSIVPGSHLVGAEGCYSFIFRTNEMNNFDQELIRNLSTSIASSSDGLLKMICSHRVLISENQKTEYALTTDMDRFPPVGGQLPIE